MPRVPASVGAIASALSPDEPFVVMDEIKKFNALVYENSGKFHRPRQLLLVWGSLVFPCVLTSVDYRFTLFKEDGTPTSASVCPALARARRRRCSSTARRR